MLITMARKTQESTSNGINLDDLRRPWDADELYSLLRSNKRMGTFTTSRSAKSIVYGGNKVENVLNPIGRTPSNVLLTRDGAMVLADGVLSPLWNKDPCPVRMFWVLEGSC